MMLKWSGITMLISVSSLWGLEDGLHDRGIIPCYMSPCVPVANQPEKLTQKERHFELWLQDDAHHFKTIAVEFAVPSEASPIYEAELRRREWWLPVMRGAKWSSGIGIVFIAECAAYRYCYHGGDKLPILGGTAATLAVLPWALRTCRSFYGLEALRDYEICRTADWKLSPNALRLICQAAKVSTMTDYALVKKKEELVHVEKLIGKQGRLRNWIPARISPNADESLAKEHTYEAFSQSADPTTNFVSIPCIKSTGIIPMSVVVVGMREARPATPFERSAEFLWRLLCGELIKNAQGKLNFESTDLGIDNNQNSSLGIVLLPEK